MATFDFTIDVTTLVRSKVNINISSTVLSSIPSGMNGTNKTIMAPDGDDDDWSTGITIVTTFDFILIGVAFLLHSIGIALQLASITRRLSNQSMLLIHLSITSFIGIGTNASAVYWKSSDIRFSKDFIVVYFVGYFAYIINIFYLALDRLLFVFLGASYKRITKNNIVPFIMFLSLWAFSIGYGLVIKYFEFINDPTYTKYSHHVYNGFISAFVVAAYLAIILKVRFLDGEKSAHRPDHHQYTLKKFLVPFFIVMTFFLFQYVPSILTAHIDIEGREKNRLYVLGLIGVNILNQVSDPLCYILLQKKIRNKMKMYLAKMYACSKTKTIATSAGAPHVGSTDTGIMELT